MTMSSLRVVYVLLAVGALGACNLERFPIESFDLQFGFEQVGYNFKSDLIQTEDNGYFVVGTSVDTTILIAKVAREGNLEYVRTNFGNGVAHAIAKTNDASKPYIIVGTKADDMFALWINEDGNQVQLDTFKAVANSIIGLVDSIAAYDVLISSNDEYIITGFVKQSFGGRRLMRMKLSSTGLFEPSSFRSFINNTYGVSILEGSENNFFIAGYKDNLLLLNKISDDGILLWQKQFPDTYENGLASLTMNARGNILLLGTKQLTDKNLFLAEIDEFGNILKEVDYGTNSTEDEGAFIAPTLDNAYVLLGASIANGEAQIRISKISDKGEEIWAYNFDNAATVNPNVIFEAQEYGYAFLSQINIDGTYLYRLVKTDANGQTQ